MFFINNYINIIHLIHLYWLGSFNIKFIASRVTDGCQHPGFQAILNYFHVSVIFISPFILLILRDFSNNMTENEINNKPIQKGILW